MSAAFLEMLAKQKKKASAQGSLRFREVSNSFWEGTRAIEFLLNLVGEM